MDIKNLSHEDETSLKRRLGNVNNELGVFFMNQATALAQKIGEEEDVDERVLSSTLCASDELLRRSKEYLQEGVQIFKAINDTANIALLLSNSGRLWRIAGHIKSQTRATNKHEFGDPEMVEYRKAINEYQSALQTLGSRRTNPGVWESVTWELCCTYFTVGTLLQDQAPLSSLSREEAEKQVTENFLKALKFCELEVSGPRQIVYQYRAAIIHQRLASLYHHSYRSFPPEDNSFRRKKLRQLSENHYGKAAPLFFQLDRFGDYLRSVLERCGLYEAQAETQTSTGTKYKTYMAVLDALLTTVPALERMDGEAVSSGGDRQDLVPEAGEETTTEDKQEEAFLVKTLLQRVQATLLALFKAISSKPVKKGKDVDPNGPKIKSLYAESLKCNESVGEVLLLLNKVKSCVSAF